MNVRTAQMLRTRPEAGEPMIKRRKVFPDARFAGSPVSPSTNPDAALSHARHAARHAMSGNGDNMYTGSYPVMESNGGSGRSMGFTSEQLHHQRRPQAPSYTGQHYAGPTASRHAEMTRHDNRHQVQGRHASSASLPGVSSLLQSTGSPTPERDSFDGGLMNGVNQMDHIRNIGRLQRPSQWPSSRSPQETAPVYNWNNVNGNAQHIHQRELAARYAREQQLRRQGHSLAQGPVSQPLVQATSRPLHLNDTSPGRESPVSSSNSGDEERGDTTGSVGKNSRYLREMDRRAILERLSNGEKQATLAKEYQVSRAAICNLNKHRDEVMSRAGENPFAKHPKKRKVRPPTTMDPTDTKLEEEPVVGSTANVTPPPLSGNSVTPMAATVHLVNSRSVQLLLTKMRNQTTKMAEFRRCSERVMRLVVEDALALVPTKPVDVFLNDQVKVEGVGMEHAPCVISMEQHHCPMMDMFHLIEPDQPTGYVRLGADRSISMLAAHLPSDLRYHNVFLFDTVAISGELVCAILQRLKDKGAVESMLHVVALFVGSEVVAMVQCKFPAVHIVTAQIDSSLNSKTYRRSSLHAVISRLDHMHGDNHQLTNGP